MKNRSKLALVTALTFARFPLVLLFFVCAVMHAHAPATWLFWTGMVALIASALTDLFDGLLARRLGVVTEFGAHADPMMDKFFYLATFPLLVFVTARNAVAAPAGSGDAWHAVFLLVLTLFFLTRDQWVSFLRAIGSIYRVSGAANWLGKLRTAASFPLVCVVYAYEEAPVPFIHPVIVYTMEGFVFVVNLVSVVTYTRRYWPYLRQASIPATGDDHAED